MRRAIIWERVPTTFDYAALFSVCYAMLCYAVSSFASRYCLINRHTWDMRVLAKISTTGRLRIIYRMAINLFERTFKYTPFIRCGGNLVAPTDSNSEYFHFTAATNRFERKCYTDCERVYMCVTPARTYFSVGACHMSNARARREQCGWPRQCCGVNVNRNAGAIDGLWCGKQQCMMLVMCALVVRCCGIQPYRHAAMVPAHTLSP